MPVLPAMTITMTMPMEMITTMNMTMTMITTMLLSLSPPVMLVSEDVNRPMLSWTLDPLPLPVRGVSTRL